MVANHCGFVWSSKCSLCQVKIGRRSNCLCLPCQAAWSCCTRFMYTTKWDTLPIISRVISYNSTYGGYNPTYPCINRRWYFSRRFRWGFPKITDMTWHDPCFPGHSRVIYVYSMIPYNWKNIRPFSWRGSCLKSAKKPPFTKWFATPLPPKITCLQDEELTWKNLFSVHGPHQTKLFFRRTKIVICNVLL